MQSSALQCTVMDEVLVGGIARVVCKSDPGHWTELPPSHHKLGSDIEFPSIVDVLDILETAKVATSDHCCSITSARELGSSLRQPIN